MRAKAYPLRPRVGLICAFNPESSAELGQVPGKAIDVWPRLRSGDYLVTLEYAKPVKLGREFVTHIDALVSELVCEFGLEAQRLSRDTP
jgi:hypothetical protein